MSLVVDVKVVPRSGRTACILEKSGQLKCYLKSVPEKGRANEELLKFLSKKLRITLGDITILLGATSRTKRLKIALDIDFSTLIEKLGIELQQTL